MKARSVAGRLVRWAVVPVLAVGVGVASARAQDRDWHDNNNQQQDQRHDQRQDQRHDQRQDQRQDQRHDDHHDDHNQGYGNNNGQWHGDQSRHDDFRFRDQDRGQLQQRYSRDIRRWQYNHARAQFARGQRIPDNYRFQPVPRGYYATPPPPGYQYGYYQGYVVAYNPTTRIVADVLDLAAAFSR